MGTVSMVWVVYADNSGAQYLILLDGGAFFAEWAATVAPAHGWTIISVTTTKPSGTFANNNSGGSTGTPTIVTLPPSIVVPAHIPFSIGNVAPIKLSSSTRQPYNNEIHSIYYNPATGLYYATWVPTSPITTDVLQWYDYDTGTYITKHVFEPLSTGYTVFVTSKTSTGPWSSTINPSGLLGLSVEASSLAVVGNTLFVGSNVGIWKSTDLGISFSLLVGSPTNIIQLVVWNHVLFATAATLGTGGGLLPQNSAAPAFGVIPGGYTYAPPITIYASADSGATWNPIYNKPAYGYAAQPVGWIQTPVVVPFDSGPVIIDTNYQNIANLDFTDTITVTDSGVPFELAVPLAALTRYSAASIQPVYLGEYNGRHYICFDTTDTNLYTESFLVYSATSLGGFVSEGYAIANSPQPAPAGNGYGPLACSYNPPSLQTALDDIALSSGYAVSINGQNLAALGQFIPGGGLQSKNGVLVTNNTQNQYYSRAPSPWASAYGSYYNSSESNTIVPAYTVSQSIPISEPQTGPFAAPSWLQTVFSIPALGTYTAVAVLALNGASSPIVPSPTSLATFETSTGYPYYAVGTLADYYADTVVWAKANGVNAPLVKIIYCDATGDGSVFGAGCFAALDNAGAVYFSSDMTGAIYNEDPNAPYSVLDIAYKDGVLVCTDGSSLYITGDGKNWATGNNPSLYSLEHIT